MENKFLKSLKYILPILAVAGLGTLFVGLGMDWFNSLAKPSQWIPNVIIPIVWTVIYLAFAVILALWQNRENNIKLSTNILLIINGVLNVLWCLLFFTLHLTFVGNISIILNLVAGYLLIADIYKQNKLYGLILLIYPLCLSIATTLNTALWILN